MEVAYSRRCVASYRLAVYRLIYLLAGLVVLFPCLHPSSYVSLYVSIYRLYTCNPQAQIIMNADMRKKNRLDFLQARARLSGWCMRSHAFTSYLLPRCHTQNHTHTPTDILG
eukprot:3974004-Pleurochrysis_carterae.AAC.1